MQDYQLLYERVISSMSEGVLVFGDDGTVIFANPKAGEMLGIDKPLENMTLREFMLVEDGGFDEFVDALFAAIYEHHMTHNSSITFYLKGQEKRYFLSTGHLEVATDEFAVLAVINDITDIEKLHETFGRYVSDDVAAAILDQPEGLSMGGSTKNVTIMMSDLRGFTAMCERLEAADIVALLTHYFEAMYDAITEYHGTVIEFLGDGMLVVFGAPLERESHASDAVAAAIAMQKAMKEVNEWNEENGYPRLSMGIGINTGDTVVGNIGCEKRTKYGVLGAEVNLTGRIESYTTAGQIIISPTTRAVIPEELIIEQEAEVSPKGVDGVLHLTQVIGIQGDYDLSYELDHEELYELPTDYIMTYRTLNGKHVSDEALLGKIKAVSSEQVVLETGADIDVFDNIRMDVAGETYGKVVKKNNNIYVIDLTALPDGYVLWLKEMRGE